MTTKQRKRVKRVSSISSSARAALESLAAWETKRERLAEQARIKERDAGRVDDDGVTLVYTLQQASIRQEIQRVFSYSLENWTPPLPGFVVTDLVEQAMRVFRREFGRALDQAARALCTGAIARSGISGSFYDVEGTTFKVQPVNKKLWRDALLPAIEKANRQLYDDLKIGLGSPPKEERDRRVFFFFESATMRHMREGKSFYQARKEANKETMRQFEFSKETLDRVKKRGRAIVEKDSRKRGSINPG